MKKSLLAVAAMTAFAGAAQAQSSVSIYGVLDEAVGYETRSPGGNNQYGATMNIPTTPVKQPSATTTGTNAPGNNPVPVVKGATFLGNGGVTTSFLGIGGKEDMGGGNSAFFNLETQFDVNSGQIANAQGAQSDLNGSSGASSINGQLFNKLAVLGLKNNTWGQIGLGRQNNSTAGVIGKYDPVGATYFSPITFSGSYGGGGGITTNQRQDNSIRYDKDFGATHVNAMYKSGNQMGSMGPQSAYSFGADYSGSNWAVGAAYSNTSSDPLTSSTAFGSLYQTNGVQNAAIPSPTSATSGYVNAGANMAVLYNYNTSAITVGGKYDFSDKITGFAGYNRFVMSNPSQNMMAGTTGNVSQSNGLNVAAAYNYSGQNVNYQMFWAGTSFKATQQDTIKIGYYLLNQGAFSMTKPAASSTTSYAAGMQAWYSLLATHDLSKRTSIYGGYMFGSSHGNQAGGNPMSQVGTSQAAYYSANSVLATGIRHVF